MGSPHYSLFLGTVMTISLGSVPPMSSSLTRATRIASEGLDGVREGEDKGRSTEALRTAYSVPAITTAAGTDRA